MPNELKPTTTGYAPVNGLQMYYEIYGQGQPLVLLHGGMTTIQDFALVLPAFAQSRQVIAFERQGHGHTADMDRPFTMEQWADDIAALLDTLKIEQADVFGYSTGGSVALAFALRYLKRVRKLIVASALYTPKGYYPGIMEGLKQAKADDLPPILREMYEKVAPRPDDWPKLVKKSVESAATFTGWSTKEMREITAPALVMVGDSDIVRTEHAVELHRLLPQSQLAVLPATDHVGIIIQRADWLAAMITDFLDAPMPEKQSEEQQAHDFPKSIGRPATSALLAAGYTRLEHLTRVKEADIAALHGVGPKAVTILRDTLAANGLSFAD